jgi:hypothetical protein
MRLSPLENHDYTETQKTHVNPVPTPCQRRVPHALSVENPEHAVDGFAASLPSRASTSG